MRSLISVTLIALAAISFAAPTFAEPEASNFYLLQYSPGENWNARIAFTDQPGIKAHKAYLEDLYVDDVVRMAGEIGSGPGAMVLLRVGSRDQALAVAARDPAVVNRILDVDVISWRVDMSSMRHQKRMQQPVRDPNQPFRIERLDPDSPINLKDQTRLKTRSKTPPSR